MKQQRMQAYAYMLPTLHAWTRTITIVIFFASVLGQAKRHSVSDQELTALHSNLLTRHATLLAEHIEVKQNMTNGPLQTGVLYNPSLAVGARGLTMYGRWVTRPKSAKTRFNRCPAYSQISRKPCWVHERLVCFIIICELERGLTCR
jgi:hypothetical protein